MLAAGGATEPAGLLAPCIPEVSVIAPRILETASTEGATSPATALAYSHPRIEL